MQLLRSYEPKAFLTQVEPVLLENELLNNLPLGVLYRLVKAVKQDGSVPKQGEGSQRLFLATVNDGDQPLFIMIQTLSHLILYASERIKGSEQLRQISTVAVEYILQQEDVHVPSIIGLTSTAESFAEVWQEKSGQHYEVGMEQRIYGCIEVKPIPESSGRLREAAPDEIPLISQWIHEFSKEALEEVQQEEAGRIAERGISQSMIYVWDDNGPVSMACKSRPTQHGAVVTIVYTPPQLRGRGYASSCVANLTRRMLNGEYEFTALYTDLSNPVSNHIYMNIGYEPAADSIVFVFRQTLQEH